MIRSFEDYLFFVKQDLALRGLRKYPIKRRLYPNSVKFSIRMRRLEYIKNCKKGLFWKIMYFLLFYRWKLLGVRLGFSIGLNIFDYGASIQHHGCIIINDHAKIGKNCRIHNCVVIGNDGTGTPVIGDNAYIGPGAKIFGGIVIGNNVKIGANSVVNKSFPDKVIIAGAPARIINKIN